MQEEQQKQASDISIIRPLYRRYRSYETNETSSDKYLDELFRTNWKMRTESLQFPGNRSRNAIHKVDNDKSLVIMTKCVTQLNTLIKENDISSTLNRSYPPF